MAEGLTLVCPIRGKLKVSGKSADGLTPSEEKYRVEAIKHLLKCGYPASNFVIEPVIKRFGNAGRNSFRADFAVLDVPAEGGRDSDWILDHALVLAEIKRDAKDAASAAEFQVRPLLGFATNESSVAIYWDNVDHRVFWRKSANGASRIVDGPIESLPHYGHKPGVTPLTYKSLRADTPLKGLFERIESVLHAASIGPSKRFEVMLQLLLAKIFDEHDHEMKSGTPMVVQDFRAMESNVAAAKSEFNSLLGAAVKYYENHLPEKISPELELRDSTFLEIMALLAPHRITSVRHSVVQDFYMYFAKGLYKWDLAQYFTPPSVTDFIVETLNPDWNEDIHDPACGSADFLTAAFRRGLDLGFKDYASKVWGRDLSSEAVQVAVLNMVLNGDGKSNISKGNSLAEVDRSANRWDVVICNPPFGKRILERSPEILKTFDMGCEGYVRGADKTPFKSQETGILFAELCVRIARAGTGRVGLVVPNGYLGNSSPRYLELRKWILRHARVAAVVGLPRFTFKGSGADVSASVLFLEKRDKPLASLDDVESYDFTVQIINKVGWSTGDKQASPTYIRDMNDGTLILDEESEVIVDSDFASVLADMKNSVAGQSFDWLAGRAEVADSAVEGDGYSVDIGKVIGEQWCTLDPKRLSRKHTSVRDIIMSQEHFRLGDVIDVIPEATSSRGDRIVFKPSEEYDYTELQDVEAGNYRSERIRGWQLPSRGRHLAEPGDFYVGSVWGSVRKWMLVGKRDYPLVVTNGMHRFRIKAGAEDRTLDVVAGLCSEAYCVQMRALARGSDGLAEIRVDDLSNIVLPVVTDPKARTMLHPFVAQLLGGFTSVESVVQTLISEGQLTHPNVPKRTSHVIVV